MVMPPPPTCDSAALPCFHGCPAFLHRHFPSQSPPSHPLNLSLHSQQQPSPWDCSTIPKLQFPAALPCRTAASCLECMAAVRTVCFSLQLGFHRSAASLLDLNVSPLTQIIAPMWGSDPCFSSPTHQGQVQSLLTLLFSPLVPSFYCFFRCSVCSFPQVRYSCLLSAGVPHAFVCVKVYS